MINQAIEALKNGGIIAYPTESVFGLGVDPFNEEAVLLLLALKQREIEKGLILIGSDFSQFVSLIKPIAAERLQEILRTWPGPVTWVFPAKETCPFWLTGKHSSVAVRVTDHPVAKRLCEAFGGPVVSTSANLAGEKPALNVNDLKKMFPDGIDCIISGTLDGRAQPTEIRDALTLKVLRKG